MRISSFENTTYTIEITQDVGLIKNIYACEIKWFFKNVKKNKSVKNSTE